MLKGGDLAIHLTETKLNILTVSVESDQWNHLPMISVYLYCNRYTRFRLMTLDKVDAVYLQVFERFSVLGANYKNQVYSITKDFLILRNLQDNYAGVNKYPSIVDFYKIVLLLIVAAI